MNSRRYLLATISALSLATPALAQTALDEIVVTARRRDERLLTTPVAVSALDTNGLEATGVRQVTDLQFAVPGLGMQVGTFRKSTPSFSIRGFSAGGFQLTEDPAVVMYFAESPINSPVGQNQGFFDLASVQVLKGPQGTLFGRNTVVGAVLVEPKRPTDSFEGYLRGGLGNYDLRTFEGVLNVPVSDRFALRAALRREVHDGYVRNLVDGLDYDDEDSWSGRVSAKWDITDRLRTYAVYDHNEHDVVGNPTLLWSQGLATAAQGGLQPNPSLVTFGTAGAGGISFPAAVSAAGLGIAGNYGVRAGQGIISALSDLAAQQRARGLRSFAADHNVPPNSFGIPRDELPFEHVKNWGVTDHLEFDLTDNVSLKNIVSYRKVEFEYFQDTDGSPLNIHNTHNAFLAKQFSEELQLRGKSFEDRLDWIIGGYYFRNSGFDATRFSQTLGAAGLGANAVPRALTAMPVNKSRAVFGQADWKLTDDLTLTAGGRYSWDRRRIAVDNRINPLLTAPAGCAFPTLPNCLFTGTAKFDGLSYNFNLAYDLGDKGILYVAHRRGYLTGAFGARAFTLADAADPWDKSTVKDYEAGVKLQFRMADIPMRLIADAYAMNVENLQITIPKIDAVTGQLVNTSENQGGIRSHGVEVEFSAIPTEGFELNAALAWNYQKYSSDYPGPVIAVTGANPPCTVNTFPTNCVLRYNLAGTQRFGTRAPELSGSINGRYKLPLDSETGDISISANYFWQSHTWDDKRYFRVPSYGLMNARVDWEGVLGKPVDLAFWVKNVFDKDYFAGDFATNADSLRYISIIPGNPRTYGVELTYRFGAEAE